MARVEVTFRELKKSFRNLCKHAPDAEADTCCLLDALYAAECGIAAILLRENGYSSTKEIRLQKSHDIREMLAKCAHPPAHGLPSQLPVTPLIGTRKKRVLFSDLHSALRYGATLHDRERKKCAEKVTKLIKWVDGNLKGR